MQLTHILSIVAIIISVFLGFFVLIKGQNQKTNILFAIIAFGISEWIFANYMVDSVSKPQSALFWSQLTLLGPAFIPGAFFYFAYSFPEEKKLNFWKMVLLFIPTIPILFLLLTKYNVSDVKLITGQPTAAVVGFLYPYFFVYLLFSVISGLYLLIKKYYKSDGINKKQLQYIFFGFLISGIFGLVNVVLQVAGIYTFVSVGPLTSLFLMVAIAYAITKHHLFDIKVILTEAGVAIVAFAIVIQTISSNDVNQWLINGLILLFVIYGGYLLIKSVQQEIERRKQLQTLSTQLAHANEHLKELDKMKTEFVSLASHELLTPVSAIEGYLSMLLDEKLARIDDPKAIHYMDRVYNSAKRLARLVTDMLNVSRIEEGRLLVEKRELSLSGVITQTIDELKFKLEERKQKIKFESVNHWETYGDPDKIKEILVNIIGNSIKYSKDPGEIQVVIETVPTHQVQEKWASIESEIKAGPVDDLEAIKSAVDEHLKDLVGEKQILIHIKDQGIGIPKEELPKLFKKFHRVGDYTTAESQGTGLGLYITRALVELHHGRVWATSEGSGHGSTFTFSLPEAAVQQQIKDLEAQVPKTKEQLKPLAHPTKEAEEM